MRSRRSARPTRRRSSASRSASACRACSPRAPATLHGILNGIDDEEWNPATDALIARRYDAARLEAKRDNKLALQQRMGLPADADAPLFGFVGRLTEQKGVDLIAEAAPRITAAAAQLAVLGTGERELEDALRALARAHPRQVAAEIGFDEALAHLIEAGADAFLMPSRFEPCGLNQMYSQRYGTPPIAHATGGLCDSIVDCTPATLADGTATGFLFREPTAGALGDAVERAIAVYRDPAHVASAAAERDGAGLRVGRRRAALRRAVPVARRLSRAPPARASRSEPEVHAEREAREVDVVDHLVVGALAVVEIPVVEQDVAPLERVPDACRALPGEEGRPAPDVGVVVDEPVARAQLGSPFGADDTGPDVVRLLHATRPREGRACRRSARCP